MRMYDIIEKKRDGGALSDAEIDLPHPHGDEPR